VTSLAIIPARGGSKRIPGKNLADVGGVDLIGHALGSAASCAYVVVSTDDEAIATRCRGGSASIHHRKPEHATDAAQLEPVIADVLAEYGEGVTEVVLLQPTSPFRTAAHVREALRILRETGCDSVVSVTRLHSLHPAFSGEVYDGVYYPRKPGAERWPSASLGHLVYENGAIYAFTREHWNLAGSRMGGDMRALVMHWSEAVEVDTPEDLEAARRLA
jgi:CMP-N-acetylneuraminic acid synthetase